MFTAIFLQIIKVVSCLLALLVWSTLGLMIWMAMILRVAAAFSVKVTLHAFKPQDMRSAESNLRSALSYWTDGIKRILSILQSGIAGNQHEDISWETFIPTILRDIAYTVLVFGPLIVLYLNIANDSKSITGLPNNRAGISTDSQKTSPAVATAQGNSSSIAPNRSRQQEPKPASPSGTVNVTWVRKAWSTGLLPGKGVGGIEIGFPEASVTSLFGPPDAVEPATGNAGQDLGHWLIYRNGAATLAPLVMHNGTVSMVQVIDGKFGVGASVPGYQKASFGSSETSLKQILGNPQSRSVHTSNLCSRLIGDASAVTLYYPGIRFTLCSHNDRVAIINIVK